VKRPKIGDVIEIDTGEGFAYAHYSHKHEEWGCLLRVYNKRYPERPVDLAAAVAGEPTFYKFFPLGSYVHRGVVTIADHVPLSEAAMVFPRFRNGNPDLAGKVHLWSIWDGERSVRVGPLTDEIRTLSQLGLCDDVFLIHQIVTGWTPETDPRLG
jgi:hypothetical protein